MNEFNNYTDDAANNVPKELLNVGTTDDEIDADTSSELLSMSPKLRRVIGHIMNLTSEGRLEEVDEIYSTLNDEDAEKLGDILSKLSEIFSDNYKKKINQN